jgi:hypothetical protein
MEDALRIIENQRREGQTWICPYLPDDIPPYQDEYGLPTDLPAVSPIETTPWEYSKFINPKMVSWHSECSMFDQVRRRVLVFAKQHFEFRALNCNKYLEKLNIPGWILDQTLTENNSVHLCNFDSDVVYDPETREVAVDDMFEGRYNISAMSEEGYIVLRAGSCILLPFEKEKFKQWIDSCRK